MSTLHHNHPEAAERTPAAAAPLKPRTAPRTIDPALIDALKDLRQREGLTNKQLGTLMDYSEAQVSRALRGEFSGNVQNFETAARDALKAAEERRRGPREKVQTKGYLVEGMNHFLTTVASTSDIGVAWSPAGKGKTKGAQVYASRDSLCVMVTALESRRGWRAIRKAIMDALPGSVRPRQGEAHEDFIQRVFAGSGRLLIIDNAHLLTQSACLWLAYDWHEETGCPLALIGNEEIKDQWSRNDQLHSRVGLAYEVRGAKEVAAESAARASLATYLPAALDDAEATALAVKVINSPGHARRLKKHLHLAGDLMQAEAMSPAQALREANKLLLGTKLAA